MRFNGYRFLADENIQPSVIQFLRSLNFDVISTLSEDLIGHSDEDVAAHAYIRERVILTQDQDFVKCFIQPIQNSLE